ncbi:MAG TPA: protein-disulfide reductase DsbD N-terminal domain-containing protein [Noviherbaspirillum sp.]
MQHEQRIFCRKLPTAIAFAMALAAIGAQAQSGGVLNKLTGKSAEPVDPALAFSVKARSTGPQQVTLDFSVRPDYYLYRERISVTLKDSPGWQIKNTAFPPTTIKEDKIFGRSPVYTQSFSVPVKLEGKSGAPASLLVQYQGCFDPLGVCYPPATAILKVAP